VQVTDCRWQVFWMLLFFSVFFVPSVVKGFCRPEENQRLNTESAEGTKGIEKTEA